jgi:hypothetical protein
MTAINSNNYGIFKSKKAKNLAYRYNLNMFDKSAYACDTKYVSLDDVKFIVDNLWLDHFMYNSPKPIELSLDKYYKIYNYLKNCYKLPFCISFS